jgi:hypothetical protein
MGKFGNISKQNKSKLKEDLDNYSIFLKNWLIENGVYIIIYLLLQLPLINFIQFNKLERFNLIIVIISWQIFLTIIFFLIILVKFQLKERIKKIEEKLTRED